MRIGLRPIRSDIAPEIGSQMKFEIAIAIVANRAWDSVRLSTRRPKVGV